MRAIVGETDQGVLMRTRRLAVPLIATAVLAGMALPAAGGTASSMTTVTSAAVTTVNGWARLSNMNVDSLSQPDVLPLSTGGAQVIWTQQDSPLTQSIRTRAVKESGGLGASIYPVVSGWGTLVWDPQIITHGTQRLVAFAGIRSTSLGEKYTGAMAYATSSNGGTWTLGTGSLSHTTTAYGSYGTAAVDDAGTPLVGVIAGSSDVVTLHRGIDPTMPAPGGDWSTSPLGGDAYSASLARDSQTGGTWAVWAADFASSSAKKGIMAQKVYPNPMGVVHKAPSSTSKSGSYLIPDQDVAVASRAGGGVWAAYKVGYPTANQIGLWRVGSTEVHLIKASDVDRVGLYRATGGRLWLVWYSGTSGMVRVSRTNSSVTRIGTVRSFRPPTSKAYPYPSVWSVGGSGSGGPLHLVINAQIGSAQPQIWYRKVLPGLTLGVSPRSLNKGFVVARVADAGTPVSGARVTFLGHSKLTSRYGTARFLVSSAVPRGKKGLTASKLGYAPGHGYLTVT